MWFGANPGQVYGNTDLNEKIQALLTFLGNCLMIEDYHNRPDCQQFLDAMEDWAITADQVKSDPNFQEQIISVTQFNDKFLNNFIANKLRMNI